MLSFPHRGSSISELWNPKSQASPSDVRTLWGVRSQGWGDIGSLLMGKVALEVGRVSAWSSWD